MSTDIEEVDFEKGVQDAKEVIARTFVEIISTKVDNPAGLDGAQDFMADMLLSMNKEYDIDTSIYDVVLEYLKDIKIEMFQLSMDYHPDKNLNELLNFLEEKTGKNYTHNFPYKSSINSKCWLSEGKISVTKKIGYGGDSELLYEKAFTYDSIKKLLLTQTFNNIVSIYNNESYKRCIFEIGGCSAYEPWGVKKDLFFYKLLDEQVSVYIVEKETTEKFINKKISLDTYKNMALGSNQFCLMVKEGDGYVFKHDDETIYERLKEIL